MYNNIYMDYNSPIYREKYLKYKKKYTALRNLEIQQGSGMFSFGSDPTSKHNTQMKTLLKAEITKTNNLINPLVGNKKGLTSEQKKMIMAEYKEMTSDTLPGLIKNNTEVKPNIEAPNAAAHLKELMDSKLENKTLSQWALGESADKPKDTSAPADKKNAAPVEKKDVAQVGGAEGAIPKKLAELHAEIMDKVKSKKWVEENIKDTKLENMAEQIGMMNIQITVDDLCEKLVKTSNAKEADGKKEAAVEDCNKQKSDAVGHLKQVMTKLNKIDAGQIESDKKAFAALVSAQAKLNDLAKRYIKAAGSLDETKMPKDENQVTAEEVAILQKAAIMNYKNSLNTDLDLKLTSAEEVNMDNIIAHMVKPDVTVDDAKVKKIKDMIKTVGQAPTPTSETESPTNESKEKVIANEDKKAAAKKKYYY